MGVDDCLTWAMVGALGRSTWNHEQNQSGAKKEDRGWMHFFSRVNSDVTFCYCARNADLNSEIAGPGWQLQALNESSEEKEVTSVRDWGRESKDMREEAREKGCLCLDMGGMRNRGLLWKNFLLFRIVHTGFYPGEIRRTWLQQYKHDQVQFSSQSPDSKYSRIHNSTVSIL